MRTLLFLLFCLSAAWANAQGPSVQEIQLPPLPDRVEFAGEIVPLKDPDIRERLMEEIISHTFFHSRTILLIKRANRWRAEIEPILDVQGVPRDFFYLAVTESGLDNRATSPAGTKGMWQLMSGVAKSNDLEINTYVDQRRDPWLATVAACSYIKEMKEEFGTWTNAAAAYNRGETGLRKAFANQKVTSYYDLFLNQETYRYVFRIIAYKLIMENPEAYGFVLENDDLYEPFNYSRMQIDTTINDLPEFAKQMGTTYKMLKKYNPWLDHNARYTLFVPTGSSYIIRVPRIRQNTGY